MARSWNRFVLFILLAALVWPLQAGAVQSPVALSEAQLAAQAGCRTAKAGTAPGVARWLEDCGSVDVKAAPEAAARSALAARAQTLGLRADGRDIALLQVQQSSGVTYVRFQQTYQGVPVYLGQVLVQYDRAGKVQLINNHTQAKLAVATTPLVAADRAMDVAQAHIGNTAQLRAPAEQSLVINAEKGAPELAWHIVLYTQQPLGDWHVMVSASSGKLLDSWNEIKNDVGTADVYDPNAVQQSGNTALVDSNDAASTALNNARVSVALANLASGVDTLKGSAVDTTGPGVTGCSLPYTPGAAHSATRAYSYTRDDDRFEEAVAYAAIDGVQSWFQALGFNNVNNRAIPIDVHCISDDNSYYSDSDTALHMGDGGVDDAEDADIVVHEYGHSVQANQVPGWGPSSNTEQRAMGEGFGDFLAGMYYVQKGDPTFMNTYRYCIGEWDATSYNPITGSSNGSGCLRWINGINEGTGANIGAYSGSPTEEHDDGRFWSAALTCVYEGLGADATARDNVMKLVIAQHFSLTPDSSNNAFEDAVAALVLADQTQLDGSHAGLINGCALDRGLITAPPQPTMPTPTLTTPADGATYATNSTLNIVWMTNSAPTTATYTLEYTNDCTVTPDFADDVESGVNGWAVSHVGGSADWGQVTSDANSPTHSWFASDTNAVNDQYLVSAAINVGTGAVLSFWHNYNLEASGSTPTVGYDGGVVEISTDGGSNWTDLGTLMTQNGYNRTIAGNFSSPLANRQAFSGNSGGWIETIVDLSSYAGQSVNLRFREADDSSAGASGWWVDDITIGSQVVWTSIGTSSAGATSYAWTTPSQVGSDYCVRIKGQAAGYNDSAYDIAGPFSLSDSGQVNHTLSVTLAGTGSGTVSSTPAGIDCGATCSADFADTTVVTLTAMPDGSSTFDGWSGACSGTGDCVVTMDQAQAVTATFTANSGPITHTLSVTLAGAGFGTVSSTPAGIDCGGTCSADFAASTVVTLTATPLPNSAFGGWSGACSGTGDCVVTMDQAQTVTATFIPVTVVEYKLYLPTVLR